CRHTLIFPTRRSSDLFKKAGFFRCALQCLVGINNLLAGINKQWNIDKFECGINNFVGDTDKFECGINNYIVDSNKSYFDINKKSTGIYNSRKINKSECGINNYMANTYK